MTCFCYRKKYVEDAKQDQKIAPDLVESIVRPTDHVKESLQRKIMKMHQFRPQPNQGSNCLDVRKKDRFPPEANTASEPSKF